MESFGISFELKTGPFIQTDKNRDASKQMRFYLSISCSFALVEGGVPFKGGESLQNLHQWIEIGDISIVTSF
jgi:hypothetical protein